MKHHREKASKYSPQSALKLTLAHFLLYAASNSASSKLSSTPCSSSRSIDYQDPCLVKATADGLDTYVVTCEKLSLDIPLVDVKASVDSMGGSLTHFP